MLNKLPKDLLVKLVFNYKRWYGELLRQCSGSKHHFCREDTCNAFAITNDYIGEGEEGEIFNSDNRKFRACSMCTCDFCQMHDQIMECQGCKKLLCHLCYEKYERKYFKKVNKSCVVCNKDITVICQFCDRDMIECSECKKDED